MGCPLGLAQVSEQVLKIIGERLGGQGQVGWWGSDRFLVRSTLRVLRAYLLGVAINGIMRANDSMDTYPFFRFGVWFKMEGPAVLAADTSRPKSRVSLYLLIERLGWDIFC